MPILVSQPAGAPDAASAPHCSMTIRSIDGTEAIAWDGDEWIVRQAVTGIDDPPMSVSRDQVPGLSGSLLSGIRVEERDVVLPVMIRPGTIPGVRASLSRLSNLLDHQWTDYVALDGTCDLVAITEEGERALRVVLIDGMEGDYQAPLARPEWRILSLHLLAVDPYWRGDEWTTPTAKVSDVGPYLSTSSANAWPRRIASSSVLGAPWGISVPGDAPLPPIITMTGPFTSAHITSATGLDVHVGAVAGGSTVVIDAGRHKRIERDGISDPSVVVGFPRWADLRPGAETIQIALVGAGVGATGRVHGRARWKRAW